MSRLTIDTPSRADLVMEQLYKDLERRIESSPPGLCPVDLSRSIFGVMPCSDLWKMCTLPCRSWSVESPDQKGTERQRNNGDT